MKTFTNCAEKKAKQFLNLLQGYTRGIRMTAILILLLMGVSNAWAYDFTEGTVVYFDNTLTQWSKVYLRVGKTDYNNAYQLTKVAGTQNLYKYTIPSWDGYAAFSFANSQGWTNGNTIYQPYNNEGIKPNGDYAITGQTEYFSWNLDKMRLFIPNSNKNKEHNCQYYNTDVEYNNYQRTVTITSPTNGSITVTYIDESDNSQSKTSGNFKVAQTCIITVSANPNTGYELKSLKIAGSTHTSGNTYIVRGDVTIEASFAAKTYSVNFGVHSSGNGTLTAKAGSTNINTGAKVNHGSSITFTASPTIGYRVQGWYSDANCTNSLNNGIITTYTINSLTTNANVYVKYEEIPEEKFAVTIQTNNANYGTVSPSGSQQVGASGIEIEATAKYGYKFNQWTKTGSGVTIEDPSNPTTVIKATGTGTVTATFVEDLATTKWYISGNGNGSGNDLTPGSPFTGWATNGIQMFKKSGHSTEEIYYCTITANTIASSDDHFPFKVYNATTSKYWGNSGYWVTKENNHPTLSSNSGDNMKFRPYLTGTYEFKLDATNASSPVLTVTWPVYNQLRISAANPADATNTGEFDMTGSGTYTVTRSLNANTTYTFKIVYNSDWYGANSGNLTRASSTKTLSTSSNDLTLKTDFAGNYTFTFNSSDKKLSITYPTAYTLTYGSGAGGSGTVTADNSIKSGDLVLAGTSVSLTATPADGYDFAAWYSDQACEGDAISSNNPYTFSINSNTTLYAKWKAKSFTLTWELDGGRITKEGTQAGPVETGTTLVAPIVEKDYYDFAGWDPTVPTTMPAANVTYTAQWTPKEYAITYKDQGDKTFSGRHAKGYPTTHTYNTTTTLLGATKSGYTFAGWYRDSECAGARVERLGEDVTEAITLYAKWDVASYTITFDKQEGTGGTTSVTAQYGAKLSAITIPSRDGYLFDGYYTQTSGNGTKYYNADGTTDKNMPYNVSTLYAKWVPYSQCIFFKNNLKWKDVYVYTFSNNVWYENEDSNTKYGPGVCTKVNVLEFAKMTQIDNTDIYYYILTKQNGFNHIAFSDANMYNWNEFYGNNAIYRADRSDQMPLFIPQTDQTASTTNSTKYYSSGIWMKYNSTESGYKWSSDQNDWSTNVNPFTASAKGGYTFTTTVSLSGNTTYQFKVNNIKGDWYSKVCTITQDECTNLWFQPESDTDKNAVIQPNVTGNYVFTIYLGDGKVELSLEYPLSVGDYRLSYYDAKTGLHPGHYIKKRNEDRRDTVSFFVHIENNPEIRLEYCTAIDANTSTATWELMKTYPVLKTSGANPTSAQLPGKRKSDAVLYAGEGCGIDSTGVYNFILQQSNSTAEVITDETHPYEGKYYIRTDAAAGGWDSFLQAGNKMTYSSYADKNQDFDHYFCKWITQGTNIKFVIANEYSLCISDTLNGDDIVGNTGEHIGYLPADANVRFGWDGKTNEVSRAYISGSAKAVDRFLVLTGNEYLLDIKGNAIPEGTEADNRLGLNEHELLFSDKQNWIYQLDVKANSNTEITLTAQYNEETQTFFSTSKSGEVMQATNDDYHKVRMIYDFKTNNLIAAWLLETPVQETEAESVASNMLIIREDQGDANQINFTKNQNMEIYTAYAVMTFTKDWVTGAATRDRSEYWVSFPFDVKISDVFGFSEYGDQWIMQLYDGAERAEKGNWIDSPTFWKYITNRNYTLKAGVGYVLKLNPSKMTFDHGVTDVSLFFPSQGTSTVINAEPTTITVPAHECTIERDNRNIYDSHWNLIGVPGYANLETVNTSYTTGNQAGNVSFYYAYNAADNKYAPAAAEATFKNMYAYMVQFAGTIDWKNDPQFNNIPQQLAARRNSDAEPEKRTLRLEIAQGEEVADQTFVQLQQEGATPEFDMNLDLTKIINSGANIYTLAGDARIQVAGNALPIAETTIPVGVQMATAGEYTFRMPNGTEGMVVELIDYEANTRTNLLLSDYTTTLPQGICENRFALSVKPDKVATDVENIGEGVKNNEAAKKYIIDGKLFLQKNGMLYDAQGHIVR